MRILKNKTHKNRKEEKRIQSLTIEIKQYEKSVLFQNE